MKRMFDKEEIVEIAKESGGSGGSNSLLCLSMTVSGVGIFYGGIILPKKETPYTVSEIAQYLYNNNYKSGYGTLKLLFENLNRMKPNSNNLLFYKDYGLFSPNGTAIQIGYSAYNQASFTIADGVISVSVATGGGALETLNSAIAILAEF